VLRTSEGALQLTAETGGLGRAYEEVAIGLEGEDLELAFNCNYLLEVLGVLTDETIRMEVTGQLTPCVIRAHDSADYRYILMPMQLA
jgi:DNA polymerase III subunit beta